MRVNKIVPFSVVIILIIVSFVGVTAVSGVPAPPQLFAATNLTSVAVNAPFTINGTLRPLVADATPIASAPPFAGALPFAGAIITLQKSTNNATWNNVTTNVTDANGSYQFSNRESVAGTYYYRTTYAGHVPTSAATSAVVQAPYNGNATSNVVTVQVNKIPTQLSAAINLTVVAINTPFTIQGTLKATGNAPVVGATVQLQENVSGTWTDVAGKTATTDVKGAYRITMSEATAGQYMYRTTFAGATIGGIAYAGSTSPSTMTVRVASSPTPTPSPTPSPTVTPTVKPSSFGLTVPCNVPCPAVSCAEVCGAYTPMTPCEAHAVTASPTSFLTALSTVPLSPVPAVPEFPLAMAGAGVVAVALAGIYAAMRRRL